MQKTTALIFNLAILAGLLASQAQSAERLAPPATGQDQICEIGHRIDDNGARAKGR